MGRRYANLVCKKADVDMNKRAGECTEEEVRTSQYEGRLYFFGLIMGVV